MIIYIYIYLKIHQIKKKIILKTAEIDKKKNNPNIQSSHIQCNILVRV